jgi:hypothetical protein
MSIKLNMGCGYDLRAGWVNVDHFAGCNPDQVVDLEVFPWPWSDNSVSAVSFQHSLEHLGAETKVFLKMMQELYRVCENGAVVDITVPHPRHDHFLSDPTHVRVITDKTLYLFDKQICEEHIAKGASNTPLALQLRVDFHLAEVFFTPDEAYRQKLESGEITGAELETMLRENNNIASQISMKLQVRKPFDGPTAASAV